jgi:hypothetical protein
LEVAAGRTLERSKIRSFFSIPPVARRVPDAGGKAIARTI